MDDDALSPAYRRLLSTYPRRWRAEHGAVVLCTLLELHADLGRTRPSISEKAAFALDGLRTRLVSGRHRRSAISTARPDLADVPMLLFDQANHTVPESVVDPDAQLRANVHDLHGADLRSIGVPAWIGFGRRSH